MHLSGPPPSRADSNSWNTTGHLITSLLRGTTATIDSGMKVKKCLMWTSPDTMPFPNKHRSTNLDSCYC